MAHHAMGVLRILIILIGTQVAATANNYNVNFTPYEFRTRALALIPPTYPTGNFEGIVMNVTFTNQTCASFKAAKTTFALSCAFLGATMATITSTIELLFSDHPVSVETGKKIYGKSLFKLSNSIKGSKKTLTHVFLLLFITVLESFFFLHLAMTTLNGFVSKLPQGMLNDHPAFHDEAAAAHFVIEQLKHVFLSIPRPKRPALSSIPRKTLRSYRSMSRGARYVVVEDSQELEGHDLQTRRYVALQTSIRYYVDAWKSTSSMMKLTIFSSLVDLGALPINIFRQIWAILNKINNPLKFLVAYVISTLLPRVAARAYAPFAAVPVWALWNVRKANMLMNEGMSFAVGPTTVTTILQHLIVQNNNKTTNEMVIRACCLAILNFSCASPFPLLLPNDIRRPLHLRRHPALEACLEFSNNLLNHPAINIDDVDSVEVFLLTLPTMTFSAQKLVLKVLLLGLTCTQVSLGGKVLLARALKACEISNAKIDFKRMERLYNEGKMKSVHIDEIVDAMQQFRNGNILKQDASSLTVKELLKVVLNF